MFNLLMKDIKGLLKNMVSEQIEELIAKAEKKCQDTFQKLQRVALFNQ